MNSRRVLLAEDHELVRIGIKALFQTDTTIQLAGETGEFENLLVLARETLPDLILLNSRLNEGMVIERIPELLSNSFCRILLLTASTDHELHLSALRFGAMGVFNKSEPANLLLKAIHCVCSGELWFNQTLTSGLLHNFRQTTSLASINKPPMPPGLLTGREIQIARLSAQGLPAKRIATQLGISEKTVRNQLVVIYDKLKVDNQIALVLKAGSIGLLSSNQ